MRWIGAIRRLSNQGLRRLPGSGRRVREDGCRLGSGQAVSSSPSTEGESAGGITLEDANGLVASLYDRCTSDDLTYEFITAEVQKLDKLTAKDLTAVAKNFGVVPGKTKKASLDAVLDKITRRKTTHVRNQF